MSKSSIASRIGLSDKTRDVGEEMIDRAARRKLSSWRDVVRKCGLAALLVVIASACGSDSPPESDPTPCVPTTGGVELCDGIDNDCDGRIDEDFALGEACSVGEGECLVEGVTKCAPDLLGTICDAEPEPNCGDCVGGACVGCTDSAQCSEGVCDTDLGACVTCLDAADCPGDAVCYFEDSNADNRCVECLSNAECGDVAASQCGPSNTCVPCSQGSDCTHLDLAQCVKDECVECTTATEASDCSGNVCDPATNTCTDRGIGGTLALNDCVSDTQCQANHACVPLTYMGNPHGNYCVPIYSGSPCSGPYGQDERSRTSVGGVTQLVCMISEVSTTPEAITEYGTTCTNDPDVCVALGSSCRQFTGGTSRCTYPCSVNEDCENTDCGPAGNRYCGL